MPHNRALMHFGDRSDGLRAAADAIDAAAKVTETVLRLTASPAETDDLRRETEDQQ